MISLGTQSLGIGLAIHLRDKFSNRSNAIARKMRMLHGSALKVQQENLQAMKTIGHGMISAGRLMTAGFASAVKASAEFQFLMKGVQAITQSSNMELERMSELALKLGRESIYTADEVGSAMEYLARSGFKTNQIYSTIDAIVALGAATDKKIGGKGGVADYMTHIMHGFNIGVEGSRRVADLMTKATIVSSSDVEDVHEALKYFAGTAKTLNITLEESLAMVATLSNSGLRGGIAGRAVNNMLLYLATAVGKFKTKRQAEAMQALGLSIKDIVDTKGNIRPVIELVQAFGKNLRHLPKVDQVSALKQLLNIRGERALFPLIENSKLGLDFSAILDELTNKSGGLADKIAKMRMDNLKGDFMILQDTWKTFMIEVGNTLTPLVRWGTQFATKVLNNIINFAKHPLGKPFIIMAAAAGVALVVAGGLLVAFTSIKLIAVGSTVSFANMGRVLALAWNQGTAAALRYITTAKGATMVMTPGGPRWRGAGGRFVAGPKGMTLKGGGFLGGGMFKAFGNFTKNLISAGGFLRILGGAARVLTGSVGWIAGVITFVVGFRNVVKLIVFGLGTLLNSIIFAAQAIWAVMKNVVTPWNIPSDIAKYKERFVTAQDNMIEQFGMRRMTGGLQLNNPKKDNTIGFQDKFDSMMKDFDSRKKTVNLTLDGRKVGSYTEEERAKELRTLLAPVPNN
jgi:TP901 family phage tail tape measure protein